MALDENKKNKPQSDGVAQQPGIKAESSGTSGLTGKNEGEPNVSSGAMDGKGTFGSGQNGPGMKQPSGNEKKGKTEDEKRGLGKGFPDGPGDPEAAQEGLI